MRDLAVSAARRRGLGCACDRPRVPPVRLTFNG